VAVVTEGLLNYYSTADAEAMWATFASAMCGGAGTELGGKATGKAKGGFPTGLYLSDLHLGGAYSGARDHSFTALLSAFVKGKVHLHYGAAGGGSGDARAEASAALVSAGFGADVRVHDSQALLRRFGLAFDLAGVLRPLASLEGPVEGPVEGGGSQAGSQAGSRGPAQAASGPDELGAGRVKVIEAWCRAR